MSEGTQTVQQQTQEDQYLQQAQDYFGQSMGRIKGRMQSDNAQLQSYMQQLPEETQAQIQEMTNSYAQFEGTIDQAAQDAGVQDALEESAQQARQNADQASGQGPTDVAADQAGQVADQAQETVGDAADQAEGTVDEGQDVASQVAESLPEGYEALGQPFTDEQGNTILQGQNEEGNTVIVRRATDEAGDTVDSIFDQSGNLLDENMVPVSPEDEAEEEDEESEDMAGQMAEALPEGYTVVGEPTTDEQGNRVLEAQDEQGNTVTIRREIDDEGNVVDRVYDAQGNLMDERIVPNPMDEGEEVAEQPVEDSSSSDSNTTTVEEKKGSEGLLGGVSSGSTSLHPPRARRPRWSQETPRTTTDPPMAKVAKGSRKVQSSRAVAARSTRCKIRSADSPEG